MPRLPGSSPIPWTTGPSSTPWPSAYAFADLPDLLLSDLLDFTDLLDDELEEEELEDEELDDEELEEELEDSEMGFLVGLLVGFLVGCLVGCLVGLLVGGAGACAAITVAHGQSGRRQNDEV